MKKQWQQIKFLVSIYSYIKSFAVWCESRLTAILGAKMTWRIAEGANGTKNGFPVILSEPMDFEIQVQGPMGRHAYRAKNGDFYVFHKKHIVREGKVVVLFNKKLWLS